MIADTRKGEPHGTASIWWDALDVSLERSPLTGHAHAAVVIVGGGMAGVLSAYALARSGFDVALVTDGVLGGGETGRTTAHLSNAMDDRYFEVERRHGCEIARICAESHTAAIYFIESLVRDERLDCDFGRLDGYLFLPPGESPRLLDRELEAAHRAGLADVAHVRRASSFESGPCLRFPRQAQFHPLRLLSGVAAAFERMGGRIWTHSHVCAFESTPSGSGRRHRILTEAGAAIDADTVIVATNVPVNDRVAMHTKQVAHRTYALTARLAPTGEVPSLNWDTSEVAGRPGAYHYVRTLSLTGRRGIVDALIVGGGDHRTGASDDAPARWSALERWARERWPSMDEVIHRWSGQVVEPLDGLPFIGRNPGGPDGVYIVTGDSGMGMSTSAMAAIMMPALVRGEPHPWAKAFDPRRKPVHALGRFIRNIGRTTLNYADWLQRGARNVERVERGRGVIMRRGLELLAVSRTQDGVLHVSSAVCPHMGCIVRWNNAEQSWDCPCHGSRFDPGGCVLDGPALSGLKRVDAFPITQRSSAADHPAT